ncbi:TLC domain-containing protein [Mycena belliarum]|uniref:TLC domain-containing protein n=1 Tax=Mycena belliarum TaxID=1033014 RepID=A0AAD6XKK5_9AGAR|nr:TLC domain-containing protein [Mycena belliae]
MISTARKPPSGPLTDPDHHIGAALAPPSPSPSPLGPPPSSPPMPKDPLAPARTDVAPADVSVWLRWAVSPSHALALLAAPLLLAPAFALLARALPAHRRPPNPFTPFFLLSHAAPPPARILAATTAPRYTATTQLYVKGPGDLLLVAWSVVLFSFLRLLLARQLFPALAKRWGIRKEGKQIRFGEQGYAVVYWAVFGAWGVYIMSTSRTHWFQTAYFWADYPHTHLSGAMKRYYLSQIAYWVQQGGVLALGLEKRRSDFWEYVLHHLITVWMVSWSYLMNVTLLGNAVFISMDIPDTGLAARSRDGDTSCPRNSPEKPERRVAARSHGFRRLNVASEWVLEGVWGVRTPQVLPRSRGVDISCRSFGPRSPGPDKRAGAKRREEKIGGAANGSTARGLTPLAGRRYVVSELWGSGKEQGGGAKRREEKDE